MVSTLTTNLDVGIVEVLELIEELSNVSEMGLKWGEVLRIIGVFCLLPGVREVVLGLLSSHSAVRLDGGELLRAVWAASLLGKRALEVDVAMDEVPALAIKQTNSFVGRFVTIIPHRLFTTPFSRYVSQKTERAMASSSVRGTLGLGPFRF